MPDGGLNKKSEAEDNRENQKGKKIETKIQILE